MLSVNHGRNRCWTMHRKVLRFAQDDEHHFAALNM